MPRLDGATKEKLTRELTDVFAEVTGFPADIFGILFNEYEYGDAASGGRLCSSDDERPFIHFLLYSPRLKRKIKQRLATVLSEAFEIAVGHSGWSPVIHFCEHPYDNVAIEGELLSEKFAELADRKFYYELPDD
ncbi:MAG: hypothetical protein GY771_17010 [bacterium]|nr:hypothetical protein [bacterium]